VIVENRPGAGGRLAAQQLRTATTAQNTLMLANPAVMVVAPLVFKDNGYDAERDFHPGLAGQRLRIRLGGGHRRAGARALAPAGLASQPIPKRPTSACPATGSLPHFFALMTGEKAGVQAQVVGYRGSGPLLTDLIWEARCRWLSTRWTRCCPRHEAGKLRILATSGAKRSPWSPAVPTFKEAGLNLAATGWNTFFAPATMPPTRWSAWPRRSAT
jgi:tripartite-type tricarboxylate transporter receptor subunit TctC